MNELNQGPLMIKIRITDLKVNVRKQNLRGEVHPKVVPKFNRNLKGVTRPVGPITETETSQKNFTDV